MVQRNKNHKTCKNSIPYVRSSQPWLGRASWGGASKKGGVEWGPDEHLLSHFGTDVGVQGWGWGSKPGARIVYTSSHFLSHPLRTPSPHLGLQHRRAWLAAPGGSKKWPSSLHIPTFAWCLGHLGPAQRVPRVLGLRTWACQRLLPDPLQGSEEGRRRA